MTLNVLTLARGDLFEYAGTTVRVLGNWHDARDLFGRPMRQIMCRRLDTNAEGGMMFGPGARLEVEMVEL